MFQERSNDYVFKDDRFGFDLCLFDIFVDGLGGAPAESGAV